MSPIPDPLTGKAIEEAGRVLPEVYKDTVQPAAREVGTALGRAVRIALAPVRGLAWTWEHAEDWVEHAVTMRLARRGLAPEHIVSPQPQITAGVIRGVQAAGPETDTTLRELFANLLATAMEGERASQAHPAFAEILGQVIPDEAKILSAAARRSPSPIVVSALAEHVAGHLPMHHDDILERSILPQEVELTNPDRLQSYMDNLLRLGIVRPQAERFDHGDLYFVASARQPEPSERWQRWRLIRAYLNAYGVADLREVVNAFESECVGAPPIGAEIRAGITLRLLWPTSFGEQLLKAVVAPEEYGRTGTVTLDDDTPENPASTTLPDRHSDIRE